MRDAGGRTEKGLLKNRAVLVLRKYSFDFQEYGQRGYDIYMVQAGKPMTVCGDSSP